GACVATAWRACDERGMRRNGGADRTYATPIAKRTACVTHARYEFSPSPYVALLLHNAPSLRASADGGSHASVGRCLNYCGSERRESVAGAGTARIRPESVRLGERRLRVGAWRQDERCPVRGRRADRAAPDDFRQRRQVRRSPD